MAERPSWLKMAVFLLLASMLSLGNLLINPSRPHWSEDTLMEGEIRIAEALASKDSILWVDARSLKDYEAGKIQQALLLNEDQWDELLPEFLMAWQPNMRVIVYCSSQKCQASHEVAKRLRTEVGIGEVYVLKGGWESWLARNE